jgi:arginine/lysine/histidine transport system permease protein
MASAMSLNFTAILPSLPFILEGIAVTLKFTIFSLLCGLPLGILLALGKISSFKFIKLFANLYTSLFRGTPLLVQLGIFYFATPQLTGYTISAFEAGVITFSLNSAAYSSEIIRAGILSIDQGQWEAAQMLGLNYRQTLIGIIMPQAVRNILPALVNEMVDLLKESALVSTIGETDLLRRAQIVASEKYLYFEPLILVAACYYILVMIVSFSAKKLEKRMHHA